MQGIKGIINAVFNVPIKNIKISIRLEGPLHWSLALPNIDTLAGLLAFQKGMFVTELEISDINTKCSAIRNPVFAATRKAFKPLRMVDGMRFTYWGSEHGFFDDSPGWEEPYGKEEVFKWEELVANLT